MKEEIFYPNKLTPEEIKELSGWKLKLATIHFGLTRGDCVEMNYGYIWMKENKWDKPEEAIHLIGNDENNPTKGAISLKNEIDWDDWAEILEETGFSFIEYLRGYILNRLEILKAREENN